MVFEPLMGLLALNTQTRVLGYIVCTDTCLRRCTLSTTKHIGKTHLAPFARELSYWHLLSSGQNKDLQGREQWPLVPQPCQEKSGKREA